VKSRNDRRRIGVSTEVAIAVGFVAMGVVGRLALQSWPNLSPVAGLAIAAGFLLRSRLLAIAVPSFTMVLSDQMIGGYDLPVMLTVYAALILPVAWGRLGRHLTGRTRVSSAWVRAAAAGGWGAASGVFSAATFFVATNAAWWAFVAPAGTTLSQSYLQALPFLRYTLIGDVTIGCFATALAAVVLATVAATDREESTATASATRGTVIDRTA